MRLLVFTCVFTILNELPDILLKADCKVQPSEWQLKDQGVLSLWI
jgi:hypothetical protein